MDDWKVGRQYADGSLPSVGTYGVPACWPHIRDIYTGGGLVFDGHLEIILIAGVDQLPEPTTPPITGLTVLRSVGDCGTRFSALLDGETGGQYRGGNRYDRRRHPIEVRRLGRYR